MDALNEMMKDHALPTEVAKALHGEAGGLELLTRLQWRGEPGTDETLQQMRDVVAALVPNDSILSLRDCASELVAA